MKVCKDYENEAGFPGCCGSCHEDNESFGYWFCGGDSYEVCCKVATWLKSKGVDIYE